jgi:hypothetical protein
MHYFYLFCCYFIIKAQEYEVTSNFMRIIFPSVTNKINTLLASIGTYILIMPLSIIIASFIFPEIKSLKIFSSFFGIFGTLIVVISGIFNNKITEVYNMKLFIVSKILTLEEKRIVFKAEYIRIIDDQYQKNIELYNKLQEKLLEKYFIIYDEVLMQLKDKIEIKLYANELILKLVEGFINQKNEQILGNTERFLYYGSRILIGIVVIFAVGGAIRYFWDSTNAIEGAQLARQSAKLASENNQSTINLQEITAEVIKVLKDECLTLNTVPAELVNQAVAQGFEKVSERLNKIEHALDVITNTVMTILPPKHK